MEELAAGQQAASSSQAGFMKGTRTVVLFIARVIRITVDKYVAAKRWVTNWCSVDFELPFISTYKKASFFKIKRMSCIKIHRDIQFCVRFGENQVPRCAPK
jgi:hypothetical protein